MKKTKLRYLAAIPPLLLLLGWTFISVAPAHADDTTPLTISGTGNVAAAATLTTIPQIPSCVLLRTFVGTAVTFTGFITTNSPGSSISHTLANTCVFPIPPIPGLLITTLNDVTVSCGTGSPTCPAGFSKTGGLVMQNRLTSIGLATDPTGSNIEGQTTVISGTGELEGVTGHGLVVSHLAISGTTLTGFTTYWIELTFGNSAQ